MSGPGPHTVTSLVTECRSTGGQWFTWPEDLTGLPDHSASESFARTLHTRHARPRCKSG